MASSSSSSSSSSLFFTNEWKYDVFLSFRGIDTRSGFTGSLHRALCGKEIKSFMDDQNLEKGAEINPALDEAIQSSRIAVVVLSKNYASSTFCLDELMKIMDCSKHKGMLVLPVFYEVEPSDVRYQKGTYADALNKHEARNTEKQILEKWRVALTKISHISGWPFTRDKWVEAFGSSPAQHVSSRFLHSDNRLSECIFIFRQQLSCSAVVEMYLFECKNTFRQITLGMQKHRYEYELIDIIVKYIIEKIQVAKPYLWPKALEVQIMDPTKAMKVPVGILHVKVLRAIKLRKKDLMGGADPYMELKLTDDKLPSKKTTVKYKNFNPEWNEEFKIVIKDPESQALELNIYNWEQIGKHDKMGMNVIPLKELTPDEPRLLTLDLLKTMDPNDPENEKSRGQLTVEVLYNPFKGDVLPENAEDSNAIEKAPDGTPASGGLLVVIIHEAEDVEGKHHTNPYARLIFKGEEGKTKHVKKNRYPRWGEEFHFILEEPPTNERLLVEVQSASSKMGLLHPKETLGYVHINLSDVVTNKRINEKYNLNDSRNGRIQIELHWRTR